MMTDDFLLFQKGQNTVLVLKQRLSMTGIKIRRTCQLQLSNAIIYEEFDYTQIVLQDFLDYLIKTMETNLKNRIKSKESFAEQISEITLFGDVIRVCFKILS